MRLCLGIYMIHNCFEFSPAACIYIIYNIRKPLSTSYNTTAHGILSRYPDSGRLNHVSKLSEYERACEMAYAVKSLHQSVTLTGGALSTWLL